MNNHLTTGQMIDTLKMGEIAECVSDGFYEGSKLKRTARDEIVFTDSNDFFKMTTFAHSSKWNIYKNEALPENLCAKCQFIDYGDDSCPSNGEDIDYHEDVIGVTVCQCFKGIGTNESA